MNPAPQLYAEIERVAARTEWSPAERVLSLALLLDRLFIEATRHEQIVFSTLFARICYVGHRRQFQPETLQAVQTFRRAAARARAGRPTSERDARIGVKALTETVLVLYETAAPPALLPYLPSPDEWQWQPPDIWQFKQSAFVAALRDEPEKRRLVAVDEEDPTREVFVLYDLPERNDNFKPTIQALRKAFKWPVNLHLIDVDVDGECCYRPRAFVVEPDYLIDVTAVAECFVENGVDPLNYLVRKLTPQSHTAAKFLGNVANNFLDRLLNEPDARFSDLFRETFRLWPFTYAPMSDAEVREISQKAQIHYAVLRQMALEGFEKEGILPENCILEPSFFSRQFGIQGRLDLFFRQEDRAAIVELKSGTPFKPNVYGIARSHFTQTLLYDLLVRSVYGRGLDPAKYILYSSQVSKPLCFAPTVEAEQWEALNLRNQLVAIERLLADVKPGDEVVPLLQRLAASHVPGGGFRQRDFAQFEHTYRGLSTLERQYFNAFVGFIAREQWLAKVGRHSADGPNGHAMRWQCDQAEKRAVFELLDHLEIRENQADQPEPCIVFARTADTPPLANFRQGDIAVLYPVDEVTDSVLRHQIIKCTITRIDAESIEVQLRYRQRNLKPFESTVRWALEPDLMETGFAQMYAALVEWASAPPDRRRRILAPQAESGIERPGATLIERIVDSKHFFLLWGPPGTGKTSVMLRDLAAWVLHNSADNLLLLAYTNRAVDEICEALDSIGPDMRRHYLRIGSRHATSEHFRTQLLHHKIADAENRAQLREVLDNHRIFVSTVASFAQNGELLRLKKFQRLVVDEAGQLLEPQLIGLLTRFDHVTLIGDHRQLPAVSAQGPETTLVEAEALRGIGVTDLRMSYFERIYRQCENLGLENHIGRLDAQGRMAETIMAFPNERFYNGRLRIFSPSQAAAPGELPTMRMRFYGVGADPSPVHSKTSRLEAEMAAALVLQFKAQWRSENRAWDARKTLGIITPWRAQIAQIRECLAEAGIDPEEVTVDTVERYQGGARDVILISTCVHAEWQLNSLVNRSDEGVDRKLNVALTRAREYLFMIGNEEVLRRDEHYAAFIEAYSDF